MLLKREETKCFAFLAGHESFAAAEGAIKIAAKADKVRKEPLSCILKGLGKDAAQIIARINGFTYVQTEFDYFTGRRKADIVVALIARRKPVEDIQRLRRRRLPVLLEFLPLRTSWCRKY